MRQGCLILGALTAMQLVALAEPLAPDPDLADALTKAGWRDAKLLLETPELRVVSAKKTGARHVIIAGPTDRLRDAGVQAGGTVTATLGDARHGLGAGALQEVEIHASKPRAQGGYDETSQSLIVRADGSIACAFTGPSSSSTGTACGSSGWTEVHATIKLLPTGTVVDVRYESSGNDSEPDRAGGCLAHSPIRSGPHIDRYLLTDKRICTKSATAPSVTSVDNDIE